MQLQTSNNHTAEFGRNASHVHCDTGLSYSVTFAHQHLKQYNYCLVLHTGLGGSTVP